MAQGLEALQDSFDAIFASAGEEFGDGGPVGGDGEGFEGEADSADLVGQGFGPRGFLLGDG